MEGVEIVGECDWVVGDVGDGVGGECVYFFDDLLIGFGVGWVEYDGFCLCFFCLGGEEVVDVCCYCGYF